MMDEKLWDQIKNVKSKLSVEEWNLDYYYSIYSSICRDDSHSSAQMPELFLSPVAKPGNLDDSYHIISLKDLDPESTRMLLSGVVKLLDDRVTELTRNYQRLVEQHRQEVKNGGSQTSD